MSEPTQNAIAAIVTPASAEPTALAALMGPMEFWCSLPGRTEQEKLLIYQAREGDVESLADAMNLELAVTNILLHPVTLTKESGEEITLTRCVLITEDGFTFGSCSTGVMGSLKSLIQIWGVPPWSPAKRLKCVRKVLPGGHQLYKLHPVLNSEPTNGKKGK